MATIFNPLIQNTTQTNQQLAAQVTRLADFFGVLQAPRQLQREWVIENQGVVLEEDPTINQRNEPRADGVNHGVGVEPPRVEQPMSIPKEREPRVVMVNRNQDAGEVIYQV